MNQGNIWKHWHNFLSIMWKNLGGDNYSFPIVYRNPDPWSISCSP